MFNDVSTLLDKSEKNRFIAKIRFIIQYVEAASRLYKLDIKAINSDISIALPELIDMGIVANEESLPILKSTLKKDYQDLIQAVTVYANQKAIWGTFLDHFSKNYREQLAKQDTELDKYTFADFFAGAGGLSLGFSLAGLRPELVNEIEPLAVETYKYNHPEVPSHKIVTADIKNIIDNIEDYLDHTSIDVVIGGPPCQSFSSANQQRIIDDPRNELYKYFIQAVEKIKPKFVVMENVKGMKKVAHQVVEDFNKLQVDLNGEIVSYNVDYHVFNSEDFSVAQRRERLIYIAIRNDIEEKHNITPQSIIDEIIGNTILNPRFILKDALQFLKPLAASTVKGQNEVDNEESGFKIDINNYYKEDSLYLDLINNGKKNKFTFNHKARFLNETNYEVYRLLDQGDDATNPKVSHVMPYGHRNHLFKDKYFKLVENNPSRTITAHLTMDGHSHIHPTQIRSLTPREAARIQSFPDDFIFFGPYLKTFTQIGNAVPPLMARGFAEVIKKYLD